jgi:hypothetical protein
LRICCLVLRSYSRSWDCGSSGDAEDSNARKIRGKVPFLRYGSSVS